MKIFRIMAAFMVSLGLLSGCGGEDSTSASDSGSLMIGITDAEGDFLAYVVDVTSIKLTHADGRVVETLPQSARIDFAQYVDMTEFVTAATIPNGRYTKASLVLDYSSADVQVEVNGATVQAQVKDSEGNAFTTREVEVILAGGHPLVIAPGMAQHLTLDFDLQTSHRVDTSTTPPIVTADPLLVADVEMDDPKPHRLRGLLQSVDQSQKLIQLQLRPFHRHDGDFGGFNAYVNYSTSYEIDGVAYSGSSGLTQLSLQPLASWIVVQGEIDASTHHFVATEVYAGNSVPGSNQDALTGVVTARTGDQLAVKARTIIRTDGSMIFNRDVTVTLDTNTKVTRQLSRVSADISDISVGQRVDLLGTISGVDALTMNTATHARLMMTFLSGNTVSMNDGELVLNLQHLEGLPATAYSFAGTGVTTSGDADPANYQVNTSKLSLSGVQINDPVRINGFVTPFGFAPADFNAITVTNVANVPAMLVMLWPTPETTPFVSSSESGLVIDLDGSDLHLVQRQWIRTDLGGLGQPAVQPAIDGKGIFAIHSGGTTQVYTGFGAFEAALSERLTSGDKVKRLTASGRFDDAELTLTARTINVVVTE